MRFETPDDYANAVLFVAGCTCTPRRVTQMLDEKGAFCIEHYHTDECAKTRNALLWKPRRAGSAAADTSTTKDRYLRRAAK